MLPSNMPMQQRGRARRTMQDFLTASIAKQLSEEHVCFSVHLMMAIMFHWALDVSDRSASSASTLSSVARVDSKPQFAVFPSLYSYFVPFVHTRQAER
jgi:hypothetical protein